MTKHPLSIKLPHFFLGLLFALLFALPAHAANFTSVYDPGNADSCPHDYLSFNCGSDYVINSGGTCMLASLMGDAYDDCVTENPDPLQGNLASPVTNNKKLLCNTNCRFRDDSNPITCSSKNRSWNNSNNTCGGCQGGFIQLDFTSEEQEYKCVKLVDVAKLSDTLFKIWDSDQSKLFDVVNISETDMANCGDGQTAGWKSDPDGDPATNDGKWECFYGGIWQTDTSGNVYRETGKVGIGTTSPQVDLHIHNPSTTTATVRLTNSNSGAASADGGEVRMINSQMSIMNKENSDLAFGTNNAYRMIIGSTGNVGIGTTSPSNKLTLKDGYLGLESNVDSGSNGIRFLEGTTQKWAIFYRGWDTANEDLYIRDEGQQNDFMVFKDGTGRVGIGTNDPGQRLTVIGATRASYDVAQTEFIEMHHGGLNAYINWAGDGNLDFRRDGSNKMTLTQAGDLGIGTTSPNGKFNVVGSGTIGGIGGTMSNAWFSINSATSGIHMDPNELHFIGDNANIYADTAGKEVKLIVANGTGLRVLADRRIKLEGADAGLWVEAGGNDWFIGRTGSNLRWYHTQDRMTLDTSGNLSFDGDLTVSGRDIYLGSNRLYGDNSSALYWDGNHDTVTQIILRDKQDVNYGRVYGDGNGANFGLLDGDGNWSYLAAKDSYTQFRINDSAKMTIKSDGDVGIGTTSPSHKLHIDNTAADDVLHLEGPDSFGHGARINFGDSDYVYIEEDTDDTLRLHASDGIYLGVNDYVIMDLPNTSSNAPVADAQLGFWWNDSGGRGEANMIVRSNAGWSPGFSWHGNLNGSHNKLGYLEYDGDMFIDGGYGGFSDGREKTNVKTLEGALDKILQLRGVYFEWLDKRNEDVHIGFIAQEVLPIIPEVIMGGPSEHEPDGMYHLQYDAVVPVLAEAMKEQQQIIDGLEARLAELEKK